MLLEAWKEFEVEIYVCDNPRLLYPPVADSFQSLDPISLQSRILLTNLAVVLNFCTYDLYLCRYLRLINFKDYYSISSCIAWWLAYGEKIPVPFFKPIRDRSKAFARFPLPAGIFSISFALLSVVIGRSLFPAFGSIESCTFYWPSSFAACPLFWTFHVTWSKSCLSLLFEKTLFVFYVLSRAKEFGRKVARFNTCQITWRNTLNFSY